MHRDRTQYPSVSFHARKDSHPHTNAAATTSSTPRTIPARRLISAATRTARMRTTATSSESTRRCLHEALQPQCPPVTFQIQVNVTRQASKPTSCNGATKAQRLAATQEFAHKMPAPTHTPVVLQRYCHRWHCPTWHYSGTQRINPARNPSGTRAKRLAQTQAGAHRSMAPRQHPSGKRIRTPVRRGCSHAHYNYPPRYNIGPARRGVFLATQYRNARVCTLNARTNSPLPVGLHRYYLR